MVSAEWAKGQMIMDRKDPAAVISLGKPTLKHLMFLLSNLMFLTSTTKPQAHPRFAHLYLQPGLLQGVNLTWDSPDSGKGSIPVSYPLKGQGAGDVFTKKNDVPWPTFHEKSLFKSPYLSR